MHGVSPGRTRLAERGGGAAPTVLVVMGHYLPGYRSGGILRSVVNTIEHLHGEFRFLVLTRDRDLGDAAPYPDTAPGRWIQVGPAQVRYLTPEEQSVNALQRILRETPADLIYLNSYFEPLTVKLLVLRRLGRLPDTPVIVAPRGEFAWASLSQKYAKKRLFMSLARLAGFYRGVTWHASSGFEKGDIVTRFGAAAASITTALDLSSLPPSAVPPPNPDRSGSLKVAFLARISPEKNLDYALRVLARVRNPVTFDIMGPVENRGYFDHCMQLVPTLPPHIVVRTLGGIPPDQVIATLSRYDLFLFPSGGENYGHVIGEALAAGTPVLTSTATPWRDLETKGLGWDLPLDLPERFSDVIDLVASMTDDQRSHQRAELRKRAAGILSDPALIQAHRDLFTTALDRAETSA